VWKLHTRVISYNEITYIKILIDFKVPGLIPSVQYVRLVKKWGFYCDILAFSFSHIFVSRQTIPVYSHFMLRACEIVLPAFSALATIWAIRFNICEIPIVHAVTYILHIWCGTLTMILDYFN
jgi:hypothetical protein